MPSNPYSSAIGIRIAVKLSIFVDQHDLGHVTGEQGGYNLSDDTTVAPDVAFISRQRQPQLPSRGFNPVPPDLAVEVLSPSDLDNPQRRIQDKIDIYREIGIPLLWLVYPERKAIEVYADGELTATLGIDDTLTGGDVLPDFQLPIKDIFKD
jgi:Uma2 family endonuclease